MADDFLQSLLPTLIDMKMKQQATYADAMRMIASDQLQRDLATFEQGKRHETMALDKQYKIDVELEAHKLMVKRLRYQDSLADENEQIKQQNEIAMERFRHGNATKLEKLRQSAQDRTNAAALNEAYIRSTGQNPFMEYIDRNDPSKGLQASSQFTPEQRAQVYENAVSGFGSSGSSGSSGSTGMKDDQSMLRQLALQYVRENPNMPPELIVENVGKIFNSLKAMTGQGAAGGIPEVAGGIAPTGSGPLGAISQTDRLRAALGIRSTLPNMTPPEREKYTDALAQVRRRQMQDRAGEGVTVQPSQLQSNNEVPVSVGGAFLENWYDTSDWFKENWRTPIRSMLGNANPEQSFTEAFSSMIDKSVDEKRDQLGDLAPLYSAAAHYNPFSLVGYTAAGAADAVTDPTELWKVLALYAGGKVAPRVIGMAGRAGAPVGRAVGNWFGKHYTGTGSRYLDDMLKAASRRFGQAGQAAGQAAGKAAPGSPRWVMPKDEIWVMPKDEMEELIRRHLRTSGHAAPGSPRWQMPKDELEELIRRHLRL